MVAYCSRRRQGRHLGRDRGLRQGDCRRNHGEMLDVHPIGPSVTDLIAEAALGMTLEATAWEIGATTHSHPTLAEAVGEAAMAVAGR